MDKNANKNQLDSLPKIFASGEVTIIDEDFYKENKALRITSKKWHYIVFERYAKDLYHFIRDDNDDGMSIQSACKVGI